MGKKFQIEDIFPQAVFTIPDRKLYESAWTYLDSLTKPQGSLGRLEEIAARLYAINDGHLPLTVDPALFYTVAADHGVCDQGVSPYPQAVTRQMVENFLCGGAAINALVSAAGADLIIVDAGCKGGPFPEHKLALDRRLGDGTEDISSGCAMSVQCCVKGLRTGFELACDAIKNHAYQCIGTGEMGIGNTTTAAALLCAFLDLDPASAAGPGTGSSGAMVKHKVQIIRKALALHAQAVASADPLCIMAALGGFEIVVMSGIMLGCASARKPVLVDGFISLAAYVCALAIWPGLKDYAFITHSSAEPGSRLTLDKIGEKPFLDFGLRLGEGTGAALFFPMLRSACAIFNEMNTMSGAGISSRKS